MKALRRQRAPRPRRSPHRPSSTSPLPADHLAPLLPCFRPAGDNGATLNLGDTAALAALRIAMRHLGRAAAAEEWGARRRKVRDCEDDGE